jgi:hypothetical protein
MSVGLAALYSENRAALLDTTSLAAPLAYRLDHDTFLNA